MLDWSDDDWPEFRQNFGKARRVWSRLGKLLRREGVEPRVLEMFYRAVVQAVLLFGAEIWVLLASISKKLEDNHVGFLKQVTEKKAKRQREGNYSSVAAESVLK